MPAPDDRPLTRFRRLTRWVPTPRRTWRAAKRYPRTAAVLLAAAAGLGVSVFPHARAAWVGVRLDAAGHSVTYGHYLNETLRTYAPLPADSPLWMTPVDVFYEGEGRPPGAFGVFLDDLDALPHAKADAIHYATISAADARRLVDRCAARPAADSLILWDCTFAPGAARPLVSLPHVSTLHLGGSRLPPGELRAVAAAPNLSFLSVRDCDGVAGELAADGAPPKLGVLRAGGSDLTDADFAAVVASPRVTIILASRTALTDAALAAAFPNLNRLDLAGTAVTDAGFAALAPHPGLYKLSLADTAVGDRTVAALAAACPNMSELDLAGTAVTDASFDDLAGLRDLTILNLRGTAVTAAAAARLADHPSLWELTLPHDAALDPAAWRHGPAPWEIGEPHAEHGLTLRRPR